MKKQNLVLNRKDYPYLIKICNITEKKPVEIDSDRLAFLNLKVGEILRKTMVLESQCVKLESQKMELLHQFGTPAHAILNDKVQFCKPKKYTGLERYSRWND
jgi:hypothetical protein